MLSLCWGGPAPAAETTTYVLTDVQGTVLAREDAQGNIIARYDYRPYGKQQAGPVAAGPGYTGHVEDPDTGLVYMQQRYYDPEVGRFLSVDPVPVLAGEVATFNRFSYADNEPVGNFDPFGESCEGQRGPCSDDDEPSMPKPLPVSPQVQRMRDTADCGGCIQPSIAAYVQASSSSSNKPSSNASGILSVASISPIFKLPPGRTIFRNTLSKKVLKWVDDKASKALLKKLSLKTLSISKSGLAEATPWTFFAGAMTHVDDLGGCEHGVCADEVPASERLPPPKVGE
nr:RHS repeat-associated core domain-containing protein [Frateuria flava]